MTYLSFFAAGALLVCGFGIAVAAGAAGEDDDISPGNSLAALLVAAILLTLQALLWIRLGASW